MFRVGIASLLVFLLWSSALAQMSSRQAEQKLAERQASEAVAATQPSGLTNGQVYEMRVEIEQLQDQNAKLASAVAALQQQLQNVQQANQAAAANFGGETEARVGMAMGDLKRLPNVNIELLSENTSGSLYRVCTGRIDDYADRTVDDLPSSVFGPQSHTEKVLVGSHPAKIQRVAIDNASGKVTNVELESSN